MLMKNDPLNEVPQSEWDALIYSILKPFLVYIKKDPLISREDLEGEAWVALLSASKTYDASKAKFTTYAYCHILGRIRRYIREKTRLDGRIDIEPIEVEQGYVDKTVEDTELKNTMLDAIANEPYAHFVIEHYIHGKSFRKIAKEYGISHQGVAMHVEKLLQLLEKRLSHENS